MKIEEWPIELLQRCYGAIDGKFRRKAGKDQTVYTVSSFHPRFLNKEGDAIPVFMAGPFPVESGTCGGAFFVEAEEFFTKFERI